MSEFRLTIEIYNSASGDYYASQWPRFQFNDRQLVVAMVRSILTVNSGRRARRYMAAIVKPTLRFMLDWSRVPDFALETRFRQSIRDFSVTTRIGELAQGVSCAYWKWSEGYSQITDYHGWASGFAGYSPGGKEPDFAMFNPVTGDLALMEAKGTFADDHKSQMKKALAQCERGLGLVLANRGYGTVLTMDANGPVSGEGKLHIRDPERPAVPSVQDKFRLFRRSYASWFDITGDHARADRMRGGREIDKTLHEAGANARPFAKQRQYKDFDPNLLDPLASEIAQALGFDPSNTVYKLDKSVEAALEDQTLFENLDWQKIRKRVLKMDEHSIGFPDGTVIINRQPRGTSRNH